MVGPAALSRGSGAGGDIQIQTTQVAIANGSIRTTATSNGGNLDLLINDSLSLAKGSLIRSEGLSGGSASATGANLVLQASILSPASSQPSVQWKQRYFAR